MSMSKAQPGGFFVPHDLKTPLKGPADGPLAGLTAVVKDMYDIAGERTGGGSPEWLTAQRPAQKHADAVQRLLDAGATILGKTICDEFFYSVVGTNAHYGTPTNVRAPGRLPGGSSAGSAAATAAGVCDLALGSDTGGSIRLPAACCGVVGLKPTYGRVSRAGAMPLSWSMDHLGPLTRTVADAALLLDALVSAGPYRYATTAPTWDGGAYLNAAVRGEGRFQLGVTTWSPWATAYELALEPAAQSALDLAVAELAAIGHGLEAFTPDAEPGYAPAFRTVWQAGASGIPVEGDDLARLEPLTGWLIGEGRRIGARELAEALQWLSLWLMRRCRARSWNTPIGRRSRSCSRTRWQRPRRRSGSRSDWRKPAQS